MHTANGVSESQKNQSGNGFGVDTRIHVCINFDENPVKTRVCKNQNAKEKIVRGKKALTTENVDTPDAVLRIKTFKRPETPDFPNKKFEIS